jgi:hypothetical protein
MNTVNQLKLYNSNYKMIGYLILFGVLGCLTIWVGFDGQPRALIGSLLCWIGFFGIMFKFSDRKIKVIIDEKGINDSRLQYGLIPWEDIEAIWIVRYRYYEALAIQFRNSEKYLQQMSSFEKTVRKPDQWIGWGHFAVNFIGLNKGIYDVWDHIARLKSTGQISVIMR